MGTDSPHQRVHSNPLNKPSPGHRTTPSAAGQPGERQKRWLKNRRVSSKISRNITFATQKLSTYRHRAILSGPLHDGSVASVDDWPWLIDRLHADFFTVDQQFHLAALHTHGQLVPVTVKQLFHAGEGSQHLASARAGVEEVQRARIGLETQANLLLSLEVADLPQVPGSLGSFFGYLKRSDDGVVGGKSVWIDIAVERRRGGKVV